MRTELRRFTTRPPSDGLTTAALGSHLERLARICGLLLARSPAHVARLVVAVVVDAIDCVVHRRPRSDVFIEREEVISPFLAHLNAATAVVLVLACARVVAPVNHLPKDAVLTPQIHAVSAFFRLASARFRDTYAKTSDRDVAFLTTNAATAEVPDAEFRRGFSLDRPVLNDRSGFDCAEQCVRV